jgi:hypothetical protein
MQSEGISARTANRAIERARQILASIGRQASDEERGLLWERVDELFAAEQNSKNPDRKVLNQILRTQLEVHRTNPNLKGGFVGEPAPAATPSLSAELQKAIERLDLLKPD